jgi:large subunit ribosomal protein L23
MTVLLRPLINEKSMALTKGSYFTFEISKDATKSHVQKVVKEKFGVHVLSVKIINTKPKEKMQSSRKGYYFKPGVKKAIVQLKKGEKIALFVVAAPDQEEVTVRTAEGGEPVTKNKDKTGLLGPKVKIERAEENEAKIEGHLTEKMHTQQGGKTKGEK